ncbi:TlpA family protein disulfide reductase [Tenacibaculum sediminilitoris]|uniref:TlpA family protein disulfide reductase n=1 Tax=Tenacibaculum sediminilitoris TaxID=1820334 RepID=UPI0038B50489
MIRNLFLIVFIFFNGIVLGQSVSLKKPNYLLVANNKIVTQEEINKYYKSGLIKSMNKGVSDEFRNKLVGVVGKDIVGKEFIICFELYPENEKNIRVSATNIIKSRPNKNEGFIVKEGIEAPDFVVQMLNEKKYQLSKLKGKVVLINFWATWCAPCLREFYDIQPQILDDLKDKDFIYIPISIGEKKNTVLKKMRQLKEDRIDFNAGIDFQKKIWDKYAEKTIPKSIVIDQKGYIRLLISGGAEENIKIIKKKIDSLLQR